MTERNKASILSNIQGLTKCSDHRAEQHYNCYILRKKIKKSDKSFIDVLNKHIKTSGAAGEGR